MRKLRLFLSLLFFINPLCSSSGFNYLYNQDSGYFDFVHSSGTLPAGSTHYIQNVSGDSTEVFNVSSGTVKDLTASTITVGSPTTYLKVNSGADTYWVGDGTGLLYGNMDQAVGTFDVTLTTVNDWEELDAETTNIAAGPLNDVSFPGDHFLKINTVGAYKIDYSLIPMIDSVSGGDQHVEFQIFKNGSVTGKGETHVTFKNILREIPVASNTILDLAVNDEISIGARNVSSSGKIITIDHLEMSIFMVGG